MSHSDPFIFLNSVLYVFFTFFFIFFLLSSFVIPAIYKVVRFRELLLSILLQNIKFFSVFTSFKNFSFHFFSNKLYSFKFFN